MNKHEIFAWTGFGMMASGDACLAIAWWIEPRVGASSHWRDRR